MSSLLYWTLFWMYIFLCQGTAKKSAADIEQLAQAHAIQLSASTGRELISVEAKCLANEVPKG